MDLRDGREVNPSGPSNTVFFNQNTPTTVGVVFDPNTPAELDTLYVSSTNSSTWTYNGSSYITYSAASVPSTPFFLAGTAIDAGSNKTAIIQRSGEIRIVNSTLARSRVLSGSRQVINASFAADLNYTVSGGADYVVGTSDAKNLSLQTNYVERIGVASTGAIRFNSAYTFPTADGTANFVFKTDGAGNITFVNPSSIVSTQTITSAATITATSTNDLVDITALAVGVTLANPTGTFVNGQIVSYRIKDNATPRTIAYGSKFKAFGSALPTTTVASKITLLSAMYNSVADTFETVNSQEQ